jgi:uncharacterized protein YecE (DUF72 family)
VLETPRDEGLLALLLGSTGLPLAFDLRHESWADVDVSPGVRVGDESPDAPFAYLRFRDPPYDDAALAAIAERVGALRAEGPDVYAYFRHEDEPTAPAYAARVLELLAEPG